MIKNTSVSEGRPLSDWRSRAKSASFPLSQLASAGAAMVLWLIIPRVADASAQVPAITAFGIGPVVALPLTLGVATLLPNTFRRSLDGTHSAPGAWVSPLRVAAIPVGVAAGCGLIASVFAMRNPEMVTFALTMSYAAGMGAWLVVAQLARSTNRARLMLAAAGVNPILPFVWLIVLGSGGSPELAGLLTSVSILIVVLGLGFSIRRELFGFGASKRGVGMVLQNAVALVPHLLLFAALMQGIRLSALWTGADQTIEEAHFAMLGVSASSVVVNSLHSLMTVRIQTAHDEAFERVAVRNAARYAWLGLAATAGLVIYLSVLPLLVPGSNFPRFAGALLSLSGGLIAVYFLMSSVVVRKGAHSLLLIASGAGVVVWISATLAFRPDSLNELTAVYTAGLSCTVGVALILLFRVTRADSASTRRAFMRWAGLCMLGSTLIAGLWYLLPASFSEVLR